MRVSRARNAKMWKYALKYCVWNIPLLFLARYDHYLRRITSQFVYIKVNNRYIFSLHTAPLFAHSILFNDPYRQSAKCDEICPYKQGGGGTWWIRICTHVHINWHPINRSFTLQITLLTRPPICRRGLISCNLFPPTAEAEPVYF